MTITAMLTVSNDEFWEDVTPVEFGSLPRLQDAVTVVGYPIGGDTISVTSGVVSRIEVTSYVHGATELLGVQAGLCAGYFPPSFIVIPARGSLKLEGMMKYVSFWVAHLNSCDVYLGVRLMQPSMQATLGAQHSMTGASVLELPFNP